MNSKRMFYVLSGVLALVVLANFAAVILGSQILTQKSSRLAGLKLDSAVQDEKQKSIATAKKDIDKYTELESIAKTIVPQDKDQAAVVREIVNIAEANGIKIGSISFPASTLGQVAPKATAKTEGDTTPAPKVVTSPITQATPVDGIPGLYQLQITLQQDTNTPVPYIQFINFLSALEQNRRTSQVSNISVQPSARDRSKLTFSLTLNAFIKP